MSRRPTIALCILGLFLASCESTPETALVRGPGFVLYSPFDAEVNERWAEILRVEVDAVHSFLLGGMFDPPIQVYLEPIEIAKDAHLLEQLDPRLANGVGAWAIEGRQIHIVVAAGSDGGLFAVGLRKKVRHELTHIYLARMGIDAPAWLGEGLAHELEDAILVGHTLRLHPAPPDLHLARLAIDQVALSEVWTWDGCRAPGKEQAFRLLSRSFVRFLLENTIPHRWIWTLEIFADVAELDEADEAGWRRWLEDVDLLARVEEGVRPDRPDAVRRAAAYALNSLGALKAVPAEKAGMIAAGLIDDPVCGDAARIYMRFFAGK